MATTKNMPTEEILADDLGQNTFPDIDQVNAQCPIEEKIAL